MFFHKYFNKKNEREKAKANKVEKRRKGKDGPESGDSAGEEDADEVPVAPAEVDSDGGSEEDADEAEIWKVRAVFEFFFFSGTDLESIGYESVHA